MKCLGSCRMEIGGINVLYLDWKMQAEKKYIEQLKYERKLRMYTKWDVRDIAITQEEGSIFVEGNIWV